MRQYDYTGKTVYMGIDVHKKTYSCVSLCDGEIIKKDTLPADPKSLSHYIEKYFPKAKLETAYEAGFSGFHLHRYLTDAGIKNEVVHPGAIEVASRDRVKTDKRDAKKLAVQLAAKRLNGIYVPSLSQEAKRSTTRLRDSVVKFRHQVGQKFKALLFTQGLIDIDDDSVISTQWVDNMLKQIETLNYPPAFTYTLNYYAMKWEQLTREIRAMKSELLAMQTKDELELMTIYKSAPGVADITALKIKDELGDMSQFINEKQLFSYLGLTPTEHSSGEHIRLGHISRQGRAVLRQLFVESAWVAIKKDPGLMDIYQRLSKTRGGKRAIVGVARRLAGRLRSCAKSNALYKIKSCQ